MDRHSDKAVATGSVSLFDAAFEKFDAALKIHPDNVNALLNWGTALAEKARDTGDVSLFDAALKKYEIALKIEPDNHSALNNWGFALSEKAKFTKDTKLLEAAGEKYAAALEIKPDEGYNMACYCALIGEKEKAKNHLKHCLEKGTLPRVHHMRADQDLDSLRELEWFEDLMSKASKAENRE